MYHRFVDILSRYDLFWWLVSQKIAISLQRFGKNIIGPPQSILWWTPLFRADWQAPSQSSRCLRTKFKKGFDLQVESISKSWGVERNWRFRCLNQRSANKGTFWRSSNLEEEKYAPKSNQNSAETVFRSSSALPLAKQGRGLSESTKFSGFAGSTKPAQTWPQKRAGKAARFYRNPSNQWGHEFCMFWFVLKSHHNKVKLTKSARNAQENHLSEYLGFQSDTLEFSMCRMRGQTLGTRWWKKKRE